MPQLLPAVSACLACTAHQNVCQHRRPCGGRAFDKQGAEIQLEYVEVRQRHKLVRPGVLDCAVGHGGGCHAHEDAAPHVAIVQRGDEGQAADCEERLKAQQGAEGDHGGGAGHDHLRRERRRGA